MNILIIGLGSMGKRRIRCLKTIGYPDDTIYGFDLREDRRTEVVDKYDIKVFDNFETALQQVNPDALIISVPPDVHHIYIKEAIKHNIHFFVEASVVDTDFQQIIDDLKEREIVAAPSLTLYFYPAIQKIFEVVKSGQLGKISNFIHHSGQFLPDWHTHEKVSEYYVSNPATGGGREIVPFEMGWIAKLFGFPKKVAAMVRKTIEITGAERIDDTYNMLLDYEDFLGVLVVDVVSRKPVRKLIINGSKKQLTWDWNENCINIYNPETSEIEKLTYERSKAAEGYNANIGEGMYIDELKQFLDTIDGKTEFINTMEEDLKVLKTLYAFEESQQNEQFVNINF